MKIQIEGDLFRVILRWKLKQEKEACKEKTEEETKEDFQEELGQEDPKRI